MKSLGKIHGLVLSTKKLLKKSFPAFLAASLLFYTILTIFSFGSAATKCSTNLLGGVGDQTAGLVWVVNATGSDPWPGFTKTVNYPQGEDLWNPVFASQQLVTIPYWTLSKVLGPVCSYNVLIGSGVVFSAISGLLLCWYMSRSRLAAFYSGIAFGFTPYILLKISGHPAYAFTGYVALYLLSLLYLNAKPSIKRAIIVASSLATLFYTDGYFILLGGVITIGFLVWWLIVNILNKKFKASFRVLLKPLMVAVAIWLVLLAPLVYVQKTQDAKIQQFVAGSRGNLLDEARAYTIRPFELLLPPYTNPYSPSYLRFWKTQLWHGSNPAESTVYIGLTNSILVVVLLVGTVKFGRSREKRLTRLRKWITDNQYITLLVTLFILSFLISLPPVMNILGHDLSLPSSYIIKFVTFWRVFARLFVVMILSTAVLAGLGLARLTFRLPRGKARYSVLALFFGLLFFDYTLYGFHSPPTWDYYSNAPKAITELSSDVSVDTVAYFPLNEPPYGLQSFYLSYMPLLRKNIINGYVPPGKNRPYRLGMHDMSKNDTIEALRFIGVDRIFLYSREQEGRSYDGLELISDEPEMLRGDGFYVHAYKVLPGPASTHVLVPGEGFHGQRPFADAYDDLSYPFGTYGVLSVYDVGTGGEATGTSYRINFTIKNLSTTPQHLLITSGGIIIEDVLVDGSFSIVRSITTSGSAIRFEAPEPLKDPSFLMTDWNILN